jgi:peptidoglycan/LPS O-acetylase OafA/YrhL
MIKNLQCLRAFAAINVVYFHTLLASESYGKLVSILTIIGTWGQNGVDIFFVLSGFVMIHTQIQKPKKIHEFYFSRLNRIVPIYWLITLFIVLIYFLLPDIFRNLTLDIKKIISSLFFTSKIVTGGFPIIVVGWTLEWEMLFYFIFGLSLFLKDIRKIIVLIFLFMLLIFTFSKTFLIFEFFLGVLIGYTYNKVKFNETNGLIILIIGIILLLLSINSGFDPQKYLLVAGFKLDRFFIWGIPSAFIVLGAVYYRQISNSFLVYLGNASYSIYLVQVLTVPFFYKFITYFNIEMNSNLLTILCLFLSVSFGCFFYSLIEKNLKIKNKS